MKTRRLILVAVMTIAGASLCSGVGLGAPWAGSGTESEPYLIYTAEDMQAIGADPNYWCSHFKLMSDIDLASYTGNSFNMIGRLVEFNGFWYRGFRGVFDGNGKTISNFSFEGDYDSLRYVGIFAQVGRTAAGEGVVKNVRVVDAVVSGTYCGTLVGFVESGLIENCYAEGGKVTGYWVAGGLVGGGGRIQNCWADVEVEGWEGSTGGLVGTAGGDQGKVEGCYAKGPVTGWERVGGLVGSGGALIVNCYASGRVEGVDTVGGLAGLAVSGVVNSYSTGQVQGRENVGGLVGARFLFGRNGPYINSYWDVETSGVNTSAGGEGKSTVEMQQAETFFAWGCGGAWKIDGGVDYPRLAWEAVEGQLIVNPAFWEGEGTEEYPYLIYTAEELNTIGRVYCSWNAHFRLMNDIDLSAYGPNSFNVIGISRTAPFAGLFDGDGHSISNFTYDCNESQTGGFFRCVVGEDAVIKNTRLVDPNVRSVTNGIMDGDLGTLVGLLEGGTVANCCSQGGRVEGGAEDGYRFNVGGLIGAIRNGKVFDCCSTTDVYTNSGFAGGLAGYASGEISGSSAGGTVRLLLPPFSYETFYSGGLVGWNKAEITWCQATGNVLGTSKVGGLVGYNDSGDISKSFATGRVEGDIEVGGLAASNGGTIRECYASGEVEGLLVCGGLVGSSIGEISDCYARGDIKGRRDIGGLVGEAGSRIVNCYAVGAVEGSDEVGGLVGRGHEEIECLNSYWDVESSGVAASGLGEGKTTAEMMMRQTFEEAGWDFDTPVWKIFDGVDYPRLAWEVVQAEVRIAPRVLNRQAKGPKEVLAFVYLGEQCAGGQFDAGEGVRLYPGSIGSVSCAVVERTGGEYRGVTIAAGFARDEVLEAIAENGDIEVEIVGLLNTGEWFSGRDVLRIEGARK